MSENFDRLSIHFSTCKGITRASILINRCGLIGLLSFLESRVKAPQDLAPVGSYRYLPPEILYNGLINAEAAGAERPSGIPLVTCADCGEIHCWSVSAVVEREENCVIWTLRHNHRDWDYGLEFRFDRKAYDDEITKLKYHILHIAERNSRDKLPTDE